MPRYYFHTVHGTSFRDREGEVLAGPAEASRGTIRTMGEILRDGSATFWDAGDFSIVCTDEGGAVVVGMTATRMGLGDATARLKLVD